MFEKISNYKNTLIATGAAAVAAVAVGALAYRGNLTPLAKATASKVSALKPYIATHMSQLSKATGLNAIVLTGGFTAVAAGAALALSIIGFRLMKRSELSSTLAGVENFVADYEDNGLPKKNQLEALRFTVDRVNEGVKEALEERGLRSVDDIRKLSVKELIKLSRQLDDLDKKLKSLEEVEIFRKRT